MSTSTYDVLACVQPDKLTTILKQMMDMGYDPDKISTSNIIKEDGKTYVEIRRFK